MTTDQKIVDTAAHWAATVFASRDTDRGQHPSTVWDHLAEMAADESLCVSVDLNYDPPRVLVVNEPADADAGVWVDEDGFHAERFSTHPDFTEYHACVPR